jgi:hypothetical protein
LEKDLLLYWTPVAAAVEQSEAFEIPSPLAKRAGRNPPIAVERNSQNDTCETERQPTKNLMVETFSNVKSTSQMPVILI